MNNHHYCLVLIKIMQTIVLKVKKRESSPILVGHSKIRQLPQRTLHFETLDKKKHHLLITRFTYQMLRLTVLRIISYLFLLRIRHLVEWVILCSNFDFFLAISAISSKYLSYHTYLLIFVMHLFCLFIKKKLRRSFLIVCFYF